MYYQPRGRHEKPFPVADNFFPRPLLLSEQRLAELRADAAKELAKTLAECAVYQRSRGTYLVNSPPWRAHAEHDGLSEYKAPHKTLPNTSSSRLFGTVPGNYHDVAQFFHSDTRADYFNVQKKLFPFTIDAAVLHNVPQPADASPLAYEGVKWVAYEPFALRFRMDSCHFETSGTGVDAHGKPYAFRIVLPVTFPEVPDLFKAKRSLRIVCKSVMLLLPSERSADATELFATMRNDFKSNSVPRSFYKRYLQSLHKIHTFVAARRSTKPYVLSRHDGWVLEHAHATCGVCTRPFSMLRAKRSCYVCGDFVCRKCLVKSRDVLQVQPIKRDDAAASRICTPCIKLMREDHEHNVSTPMLGGDGSEMLDIWAKSPTIHEPLRMSETPTETSYGEIAVASFRSVNRLSTSGSVTSDGSRDDDKSAAGVLLYVHEPASPASNASFKPRTGSRFVVAGTSRLSSSSSYSDRSSSCSSRPSMVSLTSPISVVGAPNEEIEYIDDDDVIYEEDPELLSQRSAGGGAILTLDTSEMARVRGDSSAVSVASVFSSTSSSHSRTASVSSSLGTDEVFQSITSSLHEQELLLRQLQVAAGRTVRRETRGASVVDVAVR